MRCRGRESWRSGSARFLVTALMLMLAVASCSVPGSEPTGQSSTALSQTSASPTPQATRPPVIDIMAAGAKQLDVFGDWLTVTDNAVWLAGKNSRRLPAMFRLNPSDGAVSPLSTFRAHMRRRPVWDGLLRTATTPPHRPPPHPPRPLESPSWTVISGFARASR